MEKSFLLGVFSDYGDLQILSMGFPEIKVTRPISVTLTNRYFKCLIKFTYLNKNVWYDSEKKINRVMWWSEQIFSPSSSCCLCWRIAKLTLISRLSPRSRPEMWLAFCDVVVCSLPSRTHDFHVVYVWGSCTGFRGWYLRCSSRPMTHWLKL